MPAQDPVYYTGEDAKIKVGTADCSSLVVSDFGITIDRGTVDQELVCKKGNWHTQGPMSIDGSLTSINMQDDAVGVMVKSIVSGTKAQRLTISGQVGDDSLHFYFSGDCQITTGDIDVGDASTVTEGSIDFQVLDPKNVTISPMDSTETGSGTRITNT